MFVIGEEGIAIHVQLKLSISACRTERGFEVNSALRILLLVALSIPIALPTSHSMLAARSCRFASALFPPEPKLSRLITG